MGKLCNINTHYMVKGCFSSLLLTSSFFNCMPAFIVVRLYVIRNSTITQKFEATLIKLFRGVSRVLLVYFEAMVSFYSNVSHLSCKRVKEYSSMLPPSEPNPPFTVLTLFNIITSFPTCLTIPLT